ncbi:hypothetical protein B0H14DRAFT_3160852 [Mycena olivaceomarginata]|nr:hypothetical protein B0H14DRAFT_3160852 [Mycena olivaceomarginata]
MRFNVSPWFHQMAHVSMVAPREVGSQHVVTNRVCKGRQQKAKTGTPGIGLVSTGDAEDLDAEVAVEVPADAEAIPEEENKHKRRPNKRYADFWRHANDMDEDLILPGI